MMKISSSRSNGLLPESDIVLCVDERKNERNGGGIHVE
jgi:hypothetical protein